VADLVGQLIELLEMVRERLTADGVTILAGETICSDPTYAWGLNASGQGV
jgi:hypothetical protein